MLLSFGTSFGEVNEAMFQRYEKVQALVFEGFEIFLVAHLREAHFRQHDSAAKYAIFCDIRR